VIFQVESVDNSKVSSNFNFDPTRLYVKDSPNRFINPTLQVAYVLANFNLVPTTVQAGKTITPDGYGAVTVSTLASDGAAEANKTSYFLNYAVQAGDPGVTLAKTDGSQTSWLYTPNCLDITLH